MLTKCVCTVVLYCSGESYDGVSCLVHFFNPAEKRNAMNWSFKQFEFTGLRHDTNGHLEGRAQNQQRQHIPADIL